MTIRFNDKDPGDIVTLSFDFSADAEAVTAPTISVTVLLGTDADPSMILVGAPTIEGAMVRQRVQNGLNGVDYGLQCFASNGSDRYSIEAILPVRSRPIASTAVPRYVTEAQFEQRFSGSELADLLANGANYAETENDAASLIDGYLSARYTLPLVSLPTMVVGWAADVTRYRLWDDHAPEEVRRRYEDALAQLKLLSQGTIALPPGSDGTPAAAGLNFGGYSAERVFTSCTLKDF
jgi:phage gp36-like protein